jgi:ABC-type branched-subunit amino acid transport system substrate-binding protein
MAWMPVAPIVPQEFTDSNSFPLTVGSETIQALVQAPLAAKLQCKSTSILEEDLPGVDAQSKAFNTQFGLLKLPVPKIIVVPASATDLSTYVAQTKGSDCVLLDIGSGQAAPYGTAAREAGVHPRQLIGGQSLPPTAFAANNAVFKGMLVVSYYQSYNDSHWATYRQAVEQHHGFDTKKYDYTNGGAQGGWVAGALLATAFKQILDKGQSLTPAAVLAFLEQDQAAASEGYGPVLNFTKTTGVPGYNRAFNTTLAIEQWNGKQLVNTDGKFHDIEPLLNNKLSTDPWFKPGTPLSS